MARKARPNRDRAVVNVVTISDIAVRCGTDTGTVGQWRAQYEFPGPLTPSTAGAETWWWPDVTEFIAQHHAELAAALPLLAAKPSRPRPGRRGAPRGPRILDPFGLQQIRAMRAQLDDQGRPRYTARQIAASLPYPVEVSNIRLYAPPRAASAVAAATRALFLRRRSPGCAPSGPRPGPTVNPHIRCRNWRLCSASAT